MDSSHVLELFHQQQFVPIVRTQTPADALWLSEMFLSIGFKTLEITWTTPNAPSVLEQTKERFPNRCIGAGTILNPSMMQEALDAGADFIASPGFHPLLLYALTARNTLYLPGVYTPTEIMLALEAGADALKLFPFQTAGGLDYLKLVRAPFPNVKLIPTGGISIRAASEVLAAGAWAVGLGGCLIPSATCLKNREESALKTHLAPLLRL